MISSIDSFSPKVIDFVLNHGFKIVNDITGLQNDEVCKIASKYKTQVVIMHMQNRSNNYARIIPFYEDIMVEIDDFFNRKESEVS